MANNQKRPKTIRNLLTKLDVDDPNTYFDEELALAYQNEIWYLNGELSSNVHEVQRNIPQSSSATKPPVATFVETIYERNAASYFDEDIAEWFQNEMWFQKGCQTICRRQISEEKDQSLENVENLGKKNVYGKKIVEPIRKSSQISAAESQIAIINYDHDSQVEKSDPQILKTTSRVGQKVSTVTAENRRISKKSGSRITIRDSGYISTVMPSGMSPNSERDSTPVSNGGIERNSPTIHRASVGGKLPTEKDPKSQDSTTGKGPQNLPEKRLSGPQETDKVPSKSEGFPLGPQDVAPSGDGTRKSLLEGKKSSILKKPAVAEPQITSESEEPKLKPQDGTPSEIGRKKSLVETKKSSILKKSSLADRQIPSESEESPLKPEDGTPSGIGTRKSLVEAKKSSILKKTSVAEPQISSESEEPSSKEGTPSGIGIRTKKSLVEAKKSSILKKSSLADRHSPSESEDSPLKPQDGTPSGVGTRKSLVESKKSSILKKSSLAEPQISSESEEPPSKEGSPSGIRTKKSLVEGKKSSILKKSLLAEPQTPSKSEVPPLESQVRTPSGIGTRKSLLEAKKSSILKKSAVVDPQIPTESEEPKLKPEDETPPGIGMKKSLLEAKKSSILENSHTVQPQSETGKRPSNIQIIDKIPSESETSPLRSRDVSPSGDGTRKSLLEPKKSILKKSSIADPQTPLESEGSPLKSQERTPSGIGTRKSLLEAKKSTTSAKSPPEKTLSGISFKSSQKKIVEKSSTKSASAEGRQVPMVPEENLAKSKMVLTENDIANPRNGKDVSLNSEGAPLTPQQDPDNAKQIPSGIGAKELSQSTGEIPSSSKSVLKASKEKPTTISASNLGDLQEVPSSSKTGTKKSSLAVAKVTGSSKSLLKRSTEKASAVSSPNLEGLPEISAISSKETLESIRPGLELASKRSVADLTKTEGLPEVSEGSASIKVDAEKTGISPKRSIASDDACPANLAAEKIAHLGEDIRSTDNECAANAAFNLEPTAILSEKDLIAPIRSGKTKGQLETDKECAANLSLKSGGSKGSSGKKAAKTTPTPSEKLGIVSSLSKASEGDTGIVPKRPSSGKKIPGKTVSKKSGSSLPKLPSKVGEDGAKLAPKSTEFSRESPRAPEINVESPSPEIKGVELEGAAGEMLPRKSATGSSRPAEILVSDKKVSKNSGTSLKLPSKLDSLEPAEILVPEKKISKKSGTSLKLPSKVNSPKSAEFSRKAPRAPEIIVESPSPDIKSAKLFISGERLPERSIPSVSATEISGSLTSQGTETIPIACYEKKASKIPTKQSSATVPGQTEVILGSPEHLPGPEPTRKLTGDIIIKPKSLTILMEPAGKVPESSEASSTPVTDAESGSIVSRLTGDMVIKPESVTIILEPRKSLPGKSGSKKSLPLETGEKTVRLTGDIVIKPEGVTVRYEPVKSGSKQIVTEGPSEAQTGQPVEISEVEPDTKVLFERKTLLKPSKEGSKHGKIPKRISVTTSVKSKASAESTKKLVRSKIGKSKDALAPTVSVTKSGPILGSSGKDAEISEGLPEVEAITTGVSIPVDNEIIVLEQKISVTADAEIPGLSPEPAEPIRKVTKSIPSLLSDNEIRTEISTPPQVARRFSAEVTAKSSHLSITSTKSIPASEAAEPKPIKKVARSIPSLLKGYEVVSEKKTVIKTPEGVEETVTLELASKETPNVPDAGIKKVPRSIASLLSDHQDLPEIQVAPTGDQVGRRLSAEVTAKGSHLSIASTRSIPGPQVSEPIKKVARSIPSLLKDYEVVSEKKTVIKTPEGVAETVTLELAHKETPDMPDAGIKKVPRSIASLLSDHQDFPIQAATTGDQVGRRISAEVTAKGSHLSIASTKSIPGPQVPEPIKKVPRSIPSLLSGYEVVTETKTVTKTPEGVEETVTLELAPKETPSIPRAEPIKKAPRSIPSLLPDYRVVTETKTVTKKPEGVEETVTLELAPKETQDVPDAGIKKVPRSIPSLLTDQGYQVVSKTQKTVKTPSGKVEQTVTVELTPKKIPRSIPSLLSDQDIQTQVSVTTPKSEEPIKKVPRSIASLLSDYQIVTETQVSTPPGEVLEQTLQTELTTKESRQSRTVGSRSIPGLTSDDEMRPSVKAQLSMPGLVPGEQILVEQTIPAGAEGIRGTPSHPIVKIRRTIPSLMADYETPEAVSPKTDLPGEKVIIERRLSAEIKKKPVAETDKSTPSKILVEKKLTGEVKMKKSSPGVRLPDGTKSAERLSVKAQLSGPLPGDQIIIEPTAAEGIGSQASIKTRRTIPSLLSDTYLPEEKDPNLGKKFSAEIITKEIHSKSQKSILEEVQIGPSIDLSIADNSQQISTHVPSRGSLTITLKEEEKVPKVGPKDLPVPVVSKPSQSPKISIGKVPQVSPKAEIVQEVGKSPSLELEISQKESPKSKSRSSKGSIQELEPEDKDTVKRSDSRKSVSFGQPKESKKGLLSRLSFGKKRPSTDRRSSILKVSSKSTVTPTVESGTGPDPKVTIMVSPEKKIVVSTESSKFEEKAIRTVPRSEHEASRADVPESDKISQKPSVQKKETVHKIPSKVDKSTEKLPKKKESSIPKKLEGMPPKSPGKDQKRRKPSPEKSPVQKISPKESPDKIKRKSILKASSSRSTESKASTASLIPELDKMGFPLKTSPLKRTSSVMHIKSNLVEPILDKMGFPTDSPKRDSTKSTGSTHSARKVDPMGFPVFEKTSGEASKRPSEAEEETAKVKSEEPIPGMVYEAKEPLKTDDEEPVETKLPSIRLSRTSGTPIISEEKYIGDKSGSTSGSTESSLIQGKIASATKRSTEHAIGREAQNFISTEIASGTWKKTGGTPVPEPPIDTQVELAPTEAGSGKGKLIFGRKSKDKKKPESLLIQVTTKSAKKSTEGAIGRSPKMDHREAENFIFTENAYGTWKKPAGASVAESSKGSQQRSVVPSGTTTAEKSTISEPEGALIFDREGASDISARGPTSAETPIGTAEVTSGKLPSKSAEKTISTSVPGRLSGIFGRKISSAPTEVTSRGEADILSTITERSELVQTDITIPTDIIIRPSKITAIGGSLTDMEIDIRESPGKAVEAKSPPDKAEPEKPQKESSKTPVVFPGPEPDGAKPKSAKAAKEPKSKKGKKEAPKVPISSDGTIPALEAPVPGSVPGDVAVPTITGTAETTAIVEIPKEISTPSEQLSLEPSEKIPGSLEASGRTSPELPESDKGIVKEIHVSDIIIKDIEDLKEKKKGPKKSKSPKKGSPVFDQRPGPDPGPGVDSKAIPGAGPLVDVDSKATLASGEKTPTDSDAKVLQKEPVLKTGRESPTKSRKGSSAFEDLEKAEKDSERLLLRDVLTQRKPVVLGTEDRVTCCSRSGKPKSREKDLKKISPTKVEKIGRESPEIPGTEHPSKIVLEDTVPKSAEVIPAGEGEKVPDKKFGFGKKKKEPPIPQKVPTKPESGLKISKGEIGTETQVTPIKTGVESTAISVADEIPVIDHPSKTVLEAGPITPPKPAEVSLPGKVEVPTKKEQTSSGRFGLGKKKAPPETPPQTVPVKPEVELKTSKEIFPVVSGQLPPPTEVSSEISKIEKVSDIPVLEDGPKISGEGEKVPPKKEKKFGLGKKKEAKPKKIPDVTKPEVKGVPRIAEIGQLAPAPEADPSQKVSEIPIQLELTKPKLGETPSAESGPSVVEERGRLPPKEAISDHSISAAVGPIGKIKKPKIKKKKEKKTTPQDIDEIDQKSFFQGEEYVPGSKPPEAIPVKPAEVEIASSKIPKVYNKGSPTKRLDLEKGDTKIQKVPSAESGPSAVESPDLLTPKSSIPSVVSIKPKKGLKGITAKKSSEMYPKKSLDENLLPSGDKTSQKIVEEPIRKSFAGRPSHEEPPLPKDFVRKASGPKRDLSPADVAEIEEQVIKSHDLEFPELSTDGQSATVSLRTSGTKSPRRTVNEPLFLEVQNKPSIGDPEIFSAKNVAKDYKKETEAYRPASELEYPEKEDISLGPDIELKAPQVKLEPRISPSKTSGASAVQNVLQKAPLESDDESFKSARSDFSSLESGSVGTPKAVLQKDPPVPTTKPKIEATSPKLEVVSKSDRPIFEKPKKGKPKKVPGVVVPKSTEGTSPEPSIASSGSPKGSRFGKKRPNSPEKKPDLEIYVPEVKVKAKSVDLGKKGKLPKDSGKVKEPVIQVDPTFSRFIDNEALEEPITKIPGSPKSSRKRSSKKSPEPETVEVYVPEVIVKAKSFELDAEKPKPPVVDADLPKEYSEVTSRRGISSPKSKKRPGKTPEKEDLEIFVPEVKVRAKSMDLGVEKPEVDLPKPSEESSRSITSPKIRKGISKKPAQPENVDIYVPEIRVETKDLDLGKKRPKSKEKGRKKDPSKPLEVDPGEIESEEPSSPERVEIFVPEVFVKAKSVDLGKKGKLPKSSGKVKEPAIQMDPAFSEFIENEALVEPKTPGFPPKKQSKGTKKDPGIKVELPEPLVEGPKEVASGKSPEKVEIFVPEVMVKPKKVDTGKQGRKEVPEDEKKPSTLSVEGSARPGTPMPSGKSSGAENLEIFVPEVYVKAKSMDLGATPKVSMSKEKRAAKYRGFFQKSPFIMPKASTSAYVEPKMDEMGFPIYNVEPKMDDMGFPIYDDVEKKKIEKVAEIADEKTQSQQITEDFQSQKGKKKPGKLQKKDLLALKSPEGSIEEPSSGAPTDGTKKHRPLFLPKTPVPKADEEASNDPQIASNKPLQSSGTTKEIGKPVSDPSKGSEANSAEVNCFGKKSSDAFQDAYSPAEKSNLTGRSQIDPQKNLEAPKETGKYNRSAKGKTSGPDSRLKPAEADVEPSGSAEKSRGIPEPSQEDKFKKGAKKPIFGTNISAASKMDTETPNIGSDGSKQASGSSKDNLESTQVAPKGSKMHPESSKIGPKASKLGQKSKMIQKSSKTDPKDSQKDLEATKMDLKASESGLNSGSNVDPVVEQETKSTDTGWTSWWFGGKSSQPSIKETSGKTSPTTDVNQEDTRTNEDSLKVDGSSGSSKLTQKTSKIGKKSSKRTTGKREGIDQKLSGKDLQSKNSAHQQFPEKVGTNTGTDLESKTSKSKRALQSTGIALDEKNSQLDNSTNVPKGKKLVGKKTSDQKILKRRHSNQQYPERIDAGTGTVLQKTSKNQVPELDSEYGKSEKRRRLNAGTQSPIMSDKQIPEVGRSHQKLPPKASKKQSQSSGWGLGSWFWGGQKTPPQNPDEDDFEKASATGTIVGPHCSSCCHKPEEIFPEIKSKGKMGRKGSTKSLPEKRKKGPNTKEEIQEAEVKKKPAEPPKNITKTKVIEVGDNKVSKFPSWFPFGRSTAAPEEKPAESDEDLGSKIGPKTSSDSTGPVLKKKSSKMGPKTSKTSPGSSTPEEAPIPIPIPEKKTSSSKKSPSRSKSPFGKGSKAPKELLEIDKDDSLEGIVGPTDPTIARVEPVDKKRSKKVKFGKKTASPLVFDHKKPPKEPKVPEKPFDDDEDVSAIRFVPPEKKKSGEAVDKTWKDPEVDQKSSNISASSSSRSIGKKPKETKSTGWFGGFFGKKNMENEESDEDLKNEDSERDLSKDSRKLPDSKRPGSRDSRVTKELTSDDFRMPKKRSKNKLEPAQVDLATNKISFSDLMADMKEKEKPTPPLPAPSGSPKSGSPKSGSPRSGSPRTGSPRSGSPRSGSPRSGSPKSGSPRNRSPQPSASKPPKKSRGLKAKRESKKASDSGPPSDSKKDHFKPEYRQEPRTSKDFGKKGAQTEGPKPQKIDIGSFFEPAENSGPSGGPSAGPSGTRGHRDYDSGRPRSPESGRTSRTYDRRGEPPPRRTSKDKSKDKKPKKERRISKEINKRKARKGGPLENVIIDEDYGDRIIYSGYDRAFAYPRGKDKGCNRDMLGEDEEYDRKIFSGYDRAFARKRCVKAMFVKEEYDSPRPLPSDRGGSGVGVGRTDCDRYGQPSNKPRYREPKYDGTRRDAYDEYWDRYERDRQKYIAREERRKNKCLGWII